MFANSLVVNIQDRVPYGARMCIMRGEFAGRICITGDFEDNQRRVNAFLFDEERWVVVPTREFLPYDDDVRPPQVFYPEELVFVIAGVHEGQYARVMRVMPRMVEAVVFDEESRETTNPAGFVVTFRRIRKTSLVLCMPGSFGDDIYNRNYPRDEHDISNDEFEEDSEE
jgi:hypothetical protein